MLSYQYNSLKNLLLMKKNEELRAKLW